MASKLYKQYLALKEKDSSYYYVFPNGLFDIFLAEDAIMMSNILNLKLTNFNDSIQKCGFPRNSEQKYFSKFESLNLKVKMVSTDIWNETMEVGVYKGKKIIDEVIQELLNLNIENLSIREVYATVENLQNKLKLI